MYSVWAKFCPSVTATDNSGVSSCPRISYAQLLWKSALMQEELSMSVWGRVWHGNHWQQNLAQDLFKWRNSCELEERGREKKRKETSACLGVVLKDKKFEAPYTKPMNELKETLWYDLKTQKLYMTNLIPYNEKSPVKICRAAHWWFYSFLMCFQHILKSI